MRTYMFFFFSDEDFKLNGDYKSPRYFGIVNMPEGEDPGEKIKANEPPGYKVGISDITDSVANNEDFLIDLRTHKHVTLV